MEIKRRKSYVAFGKIYFWTATIHKWFPLLQDNNMKNIIIQHLKWLSDENKIVVYGFVIMPTHIYFMWQQNSLNGKETPVGSFMKYTAHMFRRQLINEGKLHLYKVEARNKSHEIWKRDSLAIEIYTRNVAEQKLNYIHRNPVKGKWCLAKDGVAYYYSSAKFYETRENSFGFLKNIYVVFDGD